MARRHKISEELIARAEEVVGRTKDARELRSALAIILPGLLGIDLSLSGRVMGRSRATVARLQTEFRQRELGAGGERKKWGGRRRFYLSWQEEERFLSGFFESAAHGNMLVVSEIQRAFEKKIGHRVAESTIYRLLWRHGWRKIAPRRRHPKAQDSEQKEFKKTANGSGPGTEASP